MQRWIKVFFMIYIAVLIKLIVFKYPYEQLYSMAAGWQSGIIPEGLGKANFLPFKTIRMYIEYSDRLNSFENLAGNILTFIPFGMLFPLLNAQRSGFLHVAANALVLTLGIEIFQLISGFGAFDVDDIILNCFGVVLGYIVYVKSRSIFNYYIVQ